MRRTTFENYILRRWKVAIFSPNVFAVIDIYL